jgi:hypothetical protein
MSGVSQIQAARGPMAISPACLDLNVTAFVRLLDSPLRMVVTRSGESRIASGTARKADGRLTMCPRILPYATNSLTASRRVQCARRDRSEI